MAPARWRALVLGLGAGTAVRVLGRGRAGQHLVGDRRGRGGRRGVEDRAEEHFELESGAANRVAVGGLDGRAALTFLEGTFEQIILDAYANNMEIPHHLATVEAFAAYRERLSDGGWLTVNVGGFGAEDPIVQAWRPASPPPSAARSSSGVPLSRNWVIFARRDGRVPQPGARLRLARRDSRTDWGA